MSYEDKESAILNATGAIGQAQRHWEAPQFERQCEYPVYWATLMVFTAIILCDFWDALRLVHAKPSSDGS